MSGNDTKSVLITTAEVSSPYRPGCLLVGFLGAVTTLMVTVIVVLAPGPEKQLSEPALSVSNLGQPLLVLAAEASPQPGDERRLVNALVSAGDAEDNVWHCSFYRGRVPAGEPVVTSTFASLVRPWPGASPSKVLPSDNLAGQCLRTVVFTQTENYTVTYAANDGFRFYLDGLSVVDEWWHREGKIKRINVPIPQGPHMLQVEFYSVQGPAFISLTWKVFYRNCQGWYFNSPDLLGFPAIKQDDGELHRWGGSINFDWGEASPSRYVTTGNYSVNWECPQRLPAGTYRFTVAASKGLRVIAGGEKVYESANDDGQSHEFYWHVNRSETMIQIQYVRQPGPAHVHVTWDRVAP